MSEVTHEGSMLSKDSAQCSARSRKSARRLTLLGLLAGAATCILAGKLPSLEAAGTLPWDHPTQVARDTTIGDALQIRLTPGGIE